MSPFPSAEDRPQPAYQETIIIPASKQPVFKAGKAFKDAVAK